MRIESTTIRVRRINSWLTRGRTDRRAVFLALVAFVVGAGSALASYIAEPDKSGNRALPAKITARVPGGRSFPQASGAPRFAMSLATMAPTPYVLQRFFLLTSLH